MLADALNVPLLTELENHIVRNSTNIPLLRSCEMPHIFHTARKVF